MDVYVRADNRNRQETRIHDELRQIVESGDALKKYTANLSVLQSKYRDIVKMRFTEYDKVLDEWVWSRPYKEMEYSSSWLKQLSMSMSSVGVKKSTDLCNSYIEMAVFCDIKTQIVFMLVVIVKDTKTFLKFLKDIIPDVSDDELLAIKKEIGKLR